ncbi:EamA family transporter [Catellatospora methionotrophica]|uniref:EamA family transporter n=1 Tax=Catellatospora methionotrophica TaxID=121620 RepID=UPI0033CEB8A1
MQTQRSAGVGLGLALLSAATFGTSGTFARSLIEAGWSAEAAVAARVGIAALILAVPTVFALRGRWHVVRDNLGSIGVFGLLAVAGAQVGFFNAVRYLPIGVALLLEYLGIILVVFWMWARHGQRPRRLTLAGSAAAMLGLFFVLDLTGGGSIDPVGVLWGLGAAVGLAAYFVLSARVDERLPSVAMASSGMAIGGVVLLALGGVGALPLRATFGDVTFAGERMSWLVPIVGLSVVAAVIAYVSGIGAARILGARLSSFVGLTEVLFAVLIAWLFLGELPVPVQLLGGALIIGGVVLVRVDELRSTPPAPDEVVPGAEPVLAAQGR